MAYPGLRLRPDVYATHGHYLDLPLTVPPDRVDRGLGDGAVSPGAGRRCASAADYEAVLGAALRLLAGLAQGASSTACERGGRPVAHVWQPGDGRQPRWARPARPGRDPRRGGSAQPPRRRAAQAGAHGRGPAPRRPAGDGASVAGARPRRRARALRPHPPARAAARRRPARVDHAFRDPALEQRQLVPRARRSSTDRAQRGPLLAGDDI